MATSKVRLLLMALRKAHRSKVCHKLETEKKRRQESEDCLHVDDKLNQVIEAKIKQASQRFD